MKYAQLEIFTTVELAWMRDPTRRRNYSAATEEFRREHKVRRAFGKALGHTTRLRRDCPEARTPDGKLMWIEAARALFREANSHRAQATADHERDRRRAAGDLFDWSRFTNRWLVKYAAAY
ncbi:hypothetical protein Aco04nite_35120 [Winogradskya consettensis]|uniref:Uncharacterized protein n=1 Tax=Winogradskya consettensis TaxID=113560 RepID=A0A919SL31_9ACTN|nr:hypothetical protein [Actinoplanes consettensis]GIM73412.1 hypothetical protein Aco04nite_35120 [Actinoplanes consettensis]